MSQAFGTIAKAAHDMFVRKLSDQTARNHVMLSMLKKKGRIKYRCDGTQLTWPVRYKRHALETYTDGKQVQFKRIDPYLRATVPWRAYDMNTIVTKQETLATQSKSALFKLYGSKTRELRVDFMRELTGKFFNDGSDGENFHGAEAIFSGTYTSGSKAGTANGTYASLNQTLGNYGGTSLSNPEYAFWTPTLVAWNSSAWAATGSTFVATALEAVRYGINRTMRRNAKGERVDVIDLTLDMWEDFQNALEAKESIYVTKGKRGTLAELGFTTMYYDGVEVTWEEDVPANTGYGFNFDYIELDCMTATLVDGYVEKDVDSKGWKIGADIFGNCKFESPQHQFKLYAA
jgi:hypothetical protein